MKVDTERWSWARVRALIGIRFCNLHFACCGSRVWRVNVVRLKAREPRSCGRSCGRAGRGGQGFGRANSWLWTPSRKTCHSRVLKIRTGLWVFGVSDQNVVTGEGDVHTGLVRALTEAAASPVDMCRLPRGGGWFASEMGQDACGAGDHSGRTREARWGGSCRSQTSSDRSRDRRRRLLGSSAPVRGGCSTAGLPSAGPRVFASRHASPRRGGHEPGPDQGIQVLRVHQATSVV